MDDVRAAPAATPNPRQSRWLPALVVGAAFALAFGRLALLVRTAAVNLPFQDQWDLLRPMFADAGPWGCFFLQHGPHRQGLGGLLNWATYHATGWDVRAEAWVALLVLTLAAALGLRLAVRLRGRLAASDALFPLLLLATLNWETMLLTPNLSHGILPALLTVTLALVWTHPAGAGRTAALVAVGFLALFTGFAACAFLVSAGLAFLRGVRGGAGERRWAALVLLGSGAAVLLFARGYVWSPAVPNWHFPVGHGEGYPRFLALMYANLAGWREISAAALFTGSLLLLLVMSAAAWALRALWREPAAPRPAAVLMLTGTALVFGAFTALGRLPAGIEAAFMWRYLPLLLPALAGLALAVEAWMAAASPALRRLAGVAVLLPAVVAWGNFTPDRYAAIVADGKRRWIEAYLATHDLAAANRAADFFVYRSEPESPLIAERLRWLEARRLSFFREAPAR